MLMTWHTRFSFSRSAEDLDNEHLRAQIDDAADLVDMVRAKHDKPPSEPAYYMWRHYLDALLVAGMLYSMEWTFGRGYEDRTFWKFSRLADEMRAAGEFSYMPPPWFRDEMVVHSHRSALNQRHPESYPQDFWQSLNEGMPILWPVIKKDDPAVATLQVSKADLPLVRRGRLKVPADMKGAVTNL